MAEHDTDPNVITSAVPPPERPRTATLDPETKRKRYGAVTALIVAITSLVVVLSTSIPALIASREAKDTAETAVEQGEQNAEDAQAAKHTAQGAKLVTDAAYDKTVEKVNPLGEDVKKLREDLNVLLAERAERLRKIQDGHRARAVPPKTVSPAGAEPLPPDPAAQGAQ